MIVIDWLSDASAEIRTVRSIIGEHQRTLVDVGMSTSVNSICPPGAVQVTVTEDALIVVLNDGRTLSVPISWYPRLESATPSERSGWTLVGRGSGIHWESLDEDIRVQALIAEKTSNESQMSLKRWLAKRPPTFR